MPKHVPCLLLLLVSLVLPASGGAEELPLDLRDPTPRPVAVRFETSPEDRPGGLAQRWTEPILARVEGGERGDRLRVRIPAQAIEGELLGSRRPLPGSFSDFVWTFDVETGEVVSAELSGTLLYELRLSFLQAEVETRIQTRMRTDARAGFRQPRRVFGKELRTFCSEADTHPCVLVEPRRFDRESGYVNAVGALEVESPVKSFRTFSTLGEAIFSEVGRSELPAVASPPPGAAGADQRSVGASR